MAAAPARDAIEVRESIEAKGDVDDDVDMEDADAKDDEPRKPTDKDHDADMADNREDDEDEDQDQDEEDEEEESDSAKDLLQLIRDTSEYLCRYTIKVDGESVTLCPLRSGTHAVPREPIGTLTILSVGITRLPLASRG